jgi:hypothetical protein
MWSQDDFPGAEHVPWQLLIRARYAYEIDALVASTIVNSVALFGSREQSLAVAAAASDYVQRSKAAGEPATNEQKVGFLSTVADWDGPWCGNNPPWPWPFHGPRRDWQEEVGDPLIAVVFARAADLVNAAGSQVHGGEFHGALRAM